MDNLQQRQRDTGDPSMIHLSATCSPRAACWLPWNTAPAAVAWSVSTERCHIAGSQELRILMHFIYTISLLTVANHRQKGAHQFDWNWTDCRCWLQNEFLASASTSHIRWDQFCSMQVSYNNLGYWIRSHYNRLYFDLWHTIMYDAIHHMILHSNYLVTLYRNNLHAW